MNSSCKNKAEKIPARKRICFIVSSPLTVKAFLEDPIRILSEYSQIYVVANLASADDLSSLDHLNVEFISVPVTRKVAVLQDLIALVSMVRIFAKYRFEAIHSVTPKAGLIAMLAGSLCRLPVRIHTFTGQVWVTRKGWGRFILKNIDRLIAFLATDLLVDSVSQRQFLLDEKVIPANKSNVLYKGSISGVHIDRFKSNPIVRSSIRKDLNFSEQDVVILYVGRLSIDKGVLGLAMAFSELCEMNASVRLLIVGPDEENMQAKMELILQGCLAKVRFVGFSSSPENYMAAADILCLPSYREGFGNVVIEAAAVGVPTVGSRIYGVLDAVVDGVTGMLFPPQNVAELVRVLELVASDSVLRMRMGESARLRAQRDFSSELLAHAWLEYYDKLLQLRPGPEATSIAKVH